jgi:hypothetical protein
MRSGTTVILYTRPDCHLCEFAESLLIAQGAAYRLVDIEMEAGLEEKYGLRIPVVRNPGSESELAFPFDAEALRAFLCQA